MKNKSLKPGYFCATGQAVATSLRRVVAVLVASSVAFLAIGAAPSFAQEWPQRPVHIIVPFPPGGAIDTMTRILAPYLEAGLKQSVVVENRAGAGGIVGTTAASRSTDGHTLLMTAMGHVVVPALNSKITYDALGDFRALAPVGIVPNVLVVPASSPYKTAQDIIDAAKANPGKLTYGSAGVGSSLHMTAARFAAEAGITLTHVPYRGSVAAMTDLVSGRIDLMFDSTTSIAPFVADGRIRPLAVATSSRTNAFPDIPTIAENTLPNYAVDWWYALLAPKDLPQEGLQKVAAIVSASLQNPKVRESFAAIKVEPMQGNTQSLAEIMLQDSKKWSDLVLKLGIQVD
ncbi:tripartite tricarboxylate transporter substrate binding protein [Alcaligenaceae bacterium]|nr:tripartite tricarboxylate transporter substrate binding protein [Alcaligenaceae bacterium]